MNPKKPRTPCLSCGNEPACAGYKYCSNVCQQEYQYKQYIQAWKSGEVSGLSKAGLVSSPVKRYLRQKYADKCYLCGWTEINKITGKVPLVADHIDGDWKNNTEENLRLLCPNCDSLMPTFSALNKGRGRPNRAKSKRAREAGELARLARKKRI
ncbi:HNH endonuclease [soil metagenome]